MLENRQHNLMKEALILQHVPFTVAQRKRVGNLLERRPLIFLIVEVIQKVIYICLVKFLSLL